MPAKKAWKQDRRSIWKAARPWVRHVEYARRRCKAPEGSCWFPYYGAKGITVSLTAKQAHVLWDRDGAAQMKKPTLGRIESHVGYTFENCRFQEHSVNCVNMIHPPVEYDPEFA